MSWGYLVAAFKDPYERKARLFPGLLVLLPLLVVMCCAFGASRPLPTAVLTLVVAVGGTFALASLSRTAGKRLEERLIAKWGGIPTTIALRHRDTHFDTYTKQGLHRRLGQIAGLDLPSPEAEARDPHDADERYRAVTAQLRNMTRGAQHVHLRRENIAYGFYRNALALKPAGLIVAIVGVLFGAAMANAFAPSRPYLLFDNLAHPPPAAAIAMISSAVIAFGWLCFTKAGLKRIGFSYAERLFECLDSISKHHTTRSATQSEGPG